MKACPRCGETKPLADFGVDPTKSSGRQSHCRKCSNAARRARYYKNHDHEKTRSRTYYQALHPEARRYGERQPQSRQPRDPQKERVKYMKRHGGIDEWNRMLEAQLGLCYLCRLPLNGTPQQFIHVDHDHNCCRSGQDTQSCSACRRGLCHAWCNQIIGLCGEDMGMLRTIIASFEPIREVTAQRVADLKATRPSLF